VTALFETLEPIAARAWPPLEVGRLGEWRLHAAGGYSGRANSCWPTGAADRPLDEAITAVEAWYAARGLPARFKPPKVARLRPLAAALAARGYRDNTLSLTMVGPLVGGSAAGVEVGPAFDEGFAKLMSTVQADAADAAERLATLRRIDAPRAFAWVKVAGRTAAIGAAAIEGEWLGVLAMRTAPDHRRRGLARAVIAALSDAARSVGARRAYLQVEADNAGAVRLYERLGFKQAYRYSYWDSAR
jgi:GNAT superfamily N-acetyltransferase